MKSNKCYAVANVATVHFYTKSSAGYSCSKTV